MKKYLVETYYTCTFKTVHKLNNLDEAELSKIDQRTDGEVEVIDVKLNNRKTKVGGKKEEKSENSKLKTQLPNNIADKIKKTNEINNNQSINLKSKSNARFKMPDRRKGYIQKAQIQVTIKFIYILENMMTEKLEKYSLIQIKKVNL